MKDCVTIPECEREEASDNLSWGVRSDFITSCSDILNCTLQRQEILVNLRLAKQWEIDKATKDFWVVIDDAFQAGFPFFAYYKVAS